MGYRVKVKRATGLSLVMLRVFHQPYRLVSSRELHILPELYRETEVIDQAMDAYILRRQKGWLAFWLDQLLVLLHLRTREPSSPFAH
jgi:hypothetical protein